MGAAIAAQAIINGMNPYAATDQNTGKSQLITASLRQCIYCFWKLRAEYGKRDNNARTLYYFIIFISNEYKLYFIKILT